LFRFLARHTSSIVAGSQKDTTSGLALPDDMASCWSTQDTMLADQKLLHAIGSSNLGNQLDNLRVPVSSVTTNDQEASLDTFWDRQKDARNEGLAVMGLLENDDLFPQTRAVKLLAVVGLADSGAITDVPGFWSVNGLKETVWTFMIAG
jgi:hypothetical protein